MRWEDGVEQDMKKLKQRDWKRLAVNRPECEKKF